MTSTPPAILFGAFDRHNFGDLLIPHVVAAMMGDDQPSCAGLAERDLRADGGHQVHALQQLAGSRRETPCRIIHVGGEVLTCGAWEAAVMLLPPSDVLDVITHLDADPRGQLAWAREYLRSDDLMPYIASRTQYPAAAEVIFHAVGGTELDACDAAQREEVIAKLVQADSVSVRDEVTLEHLHSAGIPARLIPDPAVMVAALFHAEIAERTTQGETAQLRALFPGGYIAVQFSTEFGDDASLGVISTQLDSLVAETGYGVAFFRAGAAPWHDDLRAYHRIKARMKTSAVHIASTTRLWDICALIAASKLYVGSSLHGRILAMAYGLPRLNIRHPTHAIHGKHSSYAQTWDLNLMPTVVTTHDLHVAAIRALRIDHVCLQKKAVELVDIYRSGFMLDIGAKVV